MAVFQCRAVEKETVVAEEWGNVEGAGLVIFNKEVDMPGRNGTGPLGQGAMTGKGMGYCVVDGQTAQNTNHIGFGMGRGQGRGRGRGRGFGMGFGQDQSVAVSQNGEITALRKEIAELGKKISELKKGE